MDSVANMTEPKRGQSYPIVIGIIFVAICIVTCLSVLMARITSKGQNKTVLLKNKISSEFAGITDFKSYCNFADMAATDREEALAIKNDDLQGFSTETYNNAHITMWNTDMLDGSWYETYFDDSMKYGYYSVSTPEELREYLLACLKSGNELKHIYLNIDPYMLKENYYNSIYYDNEDTTYEEYIEDNIFSLVSEYSDVSFDIFLPVMPLSNLSKLSSNQFDEIYAYWYTFAMYLRWYPNTSVSFAGSQEWLVVNDDIYEDKNVLCDEVTKLVYLQFYSGEYILTPPELKGEKNNLYNLVAKYSKGDYDYTGSDYDNIVCIGDGLFNYPSQEALTVSGYLKGLTGLNSTSYADGDYTSENFANIDPSIYGAEENSLFLISCGLNDYILGMDLDEFKENIEAGINTIASAYPNATIMLIAPHYIEGAQEPYKEGYKYILSDYAYAIKRIASDTGCKFVNLYAKGGISETNVDSVLTDGIHQNCNTGLFWSTLIAKEMVN